MDAAKFSRQVRMARAALNWTVRQLAEKASVSPDTVSRAEAGDKTVRQPVWGAIQTALHVALTMESTARIYVESLRMGAPVVLPEGSLRAGRAMYEKRRRRPR